MTDQEPIAGVILTALNAALPTWADAYDTDGVPGAIGSSVPGPLPTAGVVIRLHRNEDANRRGGGGALPTYFLDASYWAQNVATCRELRRLTCATFDVKEVGGYVFVFNHESRPIDDDPAWNWYGTDTFSLC